MALGRAARSCARPARTDARSGESRTGACRPAHGGFAGSISNPAARTAASVSRFGWHPPVSHVQAGCVRSCIQAATRPLARTCSSMRRTPPGRQDAAHLAQAARHVAHAAEHEGAHHGVEGGVAERQRLRAGADERHPGGAAARLEERGVAGVEAEDAGARAVEREVAAGAAPEVENAAPGDSPGQPRAPAPEAGLLEEHHPRVVEPGDLLDSAHALLLPRRGRAHTPPRCGGPQPFVD